MQSECRELGAIQRRALGHGFAHGEHEPISGGVQDQAELVGARIAARGAIGSELSLVQLDEVLHLAATTVDSLIKVLGASLERGDDVADVATFFGRLQTSHETTLARPALGAVAKFAEAAH